MDPARQQPPPAVKPPEPWVVTQGNRKVGRPTTEAVAKATATQMNQVREGAGNPGTQFAAKQVLMG